MSEPQRDAVPAVVEQTAKAAYEPPQATFVPLQIEERLMACGKINVGCDLFSAAS